MGAGTIHLASRQHMCSCSLFKKLITPSPFPSSAAELGNCTEKCGFCVGTHSNLGRFPRGRSHSYHRGVLLTRVLQQALGAAVLSWKDLGCCFPFQELSRSCFHCMDAFSFWLALSVPILPDSPPPRKPPLTSLLRDLGPVVTITVTVVYCLLIAGHGPSAGRVLGGQALGTRALVGVGCGQGHLSSHRPL